MEGTGHDTTKGVGFGRVKTSKAREQGIEVLAMLRGLEKRKENLEVKLKTIADDPLSVRMKRDFKLMGLTTSL